MKLFSYLCSGSCILVLNLPQYFSFQNVWWLQIKVLFLPKTISMGIDKVKYWKELADYDIDTAEVVYDGGRWL